MMLALMLSQSVAPPPAVPLGPQSAVAWTCDIVGPAGEKHVVAGKFEAPGIVTQGSYASFAKISVTVDRDTTGLLIGRHPANGSYAIPRSFLFGVIDRDVVTSFSMSHFSPASGGFATVTRTDSVSHRPTFHKPVGAGYCKTIEKVR